MEQGIFKLKEAGGLYSVFFHGSGNKVHGVSGRGDVLDFSRKSRTRMGDYLRSSVARYDHMGTLTYAPDGDLKNCKRHLRAFLQAIRRYVGEIGRSRDYSLFWFIEFTNAGRPHFHFYSNFRIERYWLSATWYRIAGEGNVNHLRAGTRIERLRSGKNDSRRILSGYAIKYAQKGEQKALPDLFKDQGVGRWWGVAGDRRCVVAATTLRGKLGAVDSKFSLLESVKVALTAASKHGLAVKVAENGCFEKWDIKDPDLRWEIHRAILHQKEVNLCRVNAITSQNALNRAYSLRGTLAEYYAQQDLTERRMKIYDARSRSA